MVKTLVGIVRAAQHKVAAFGVAVYLAIIGRGQLAFVAVARLRIFDFRFLIFEFHKALIFKW